MIRWVAFGVVAADAALLQFASLPQPWAWLARFLLPTTAFILLVKTGTPRETLGLSFRDAGRDLRWTFACTLFFVLLALAGGLAAAF